MSHTTAIYDEFAIRLGALADGLGLPVSYPGLHFTPPDDGLWLELLVFWNGNIPYGLANSGPTIDQGFFRVMVGYRHGAGLMPAQQLAELVIAAFPKGSTFARARVEQTPALSGPIQMDDKLFVPVTIRWRATR